MADDAKKGQPVAVPHDPYKELYASPGTSVPDIVPNEKNRSLLRQLFRDASNGKDVFNQDVVNALLPDKPTTLYFSDPAAKVEVPEKDQKALQGLAYYALNHPMEGALGAPEADKIIDAIAQNIGVEPKFLRTEFNTKTTMSMLTFDQRVPGFAPDAKDTEVAGEISSILKRKFISSELDPFDQNQLTADLNKISQEEHYTPEQADRMASAYETNMTMMAYKDSDMIASDLLSFMVDVRTSHGTTHASMDDTYQIAIPSHVASHWIDEKDLPPKPFPGSPELVKLLVGLHELGHVKSGLPENTESETTSDRGDIVLLNDMIEQGEPNAQAVKDYILQARNVAALQNEVMEGWSAHDTATFIRESEKDGRQLDYKKFTSDKLGLAILIQGHLDPDRYKLAIIPTADIMGAVKDVMTKDSMLPSLKAEAQSYLDDAGALGYVANPNYRKPLVPETVQPAVDISPTPALPFKPLS